MDHRDRAKAVGQWYEAFDAATMTATLPDWAAEERLGSLAVEGEPIDPAADIIDREDGTTPFERAAKVPCKFIVCPTCEGHGTHVNPSIDAHGLTAEDFAEDPDFAESYHSGSYDVDCYECGGAKVVPWPTEPEDVRTVENILDARAAWAAEEDAERRMGA